MTQTKLIEYIKKNAKLLGIDAIGISSTDLTPYQPKLQQWLQKKYHGTMQYMEKYGDSRAKPRDFVPYAKSIIMARLNYYNDSNGKIARYALGRDYHKTFKKRLLKLAELIKEQQPQLKFRVFTDSGPIMEKPLAEQAGLGWIGKNTLLINKKSGSWFFLGAILTNLDLPLSTPATKHCGSCSACINICPTKAIVAPYVLDANKCIAYLTIEYKGSIPEELRKLIGTRIFGCDDCQAICPWNKFATKTTEPDFKPRHNFATPDLIEFFLWDEKTFLEKTAGSAIRRAGYICWLRNIAIALGNSKTSPELIAALETRAKSEDLLVREHSLWALTQHIK